MTKKNVDDKEALKFAQHGSDWWDVNGPLKTLHDLNPTRLAYMCKYASTLKNKRILDLGCGGGILTEALVKEGGILTGLDITEDVLSVAKTHAHSAALDITYECSPVEQFLVSEPFDIIVCMEMLEHVPNPASIIKHCDRLLKPGGLLFLSTINRTLTAYLSAIVAGEYLLNILPRQTHDFDKFIKPSELLSLCRKFDLNLMDLSGLSYNPFTRRATIVSSLSINYLLCLSKSTRDGTSKITPSS